MLPKRPSQSSEAVEKDAGFGPSHGYPKSHGGPTGPGDAPARPTPATRKTVRKKSRRASVAFDHAGRVSRRAELPRGGRRVD